ncbi:MAG: DUF2520 domain-containing protein [Bernardetiaceae bacterium]|nr:DUF2520 domain-containing protein [Bernardetiaceae bacterium]
MLRIAFIGAGHLAWHLAPALEQVGHQVTEVYSRHRKNALALAERLYKATALSHPDLSESEADLVIIALADAALPALLTGLQLPLEATVVHTSGSLPMSLLSALNRPCGVLYPLQTFSKQKQVNWKDIPICIEACNHATCQMLFSLARQLSPKVYPINSQQRRQIHLAAVIACNFANHLWHIAAQVLEPAGFTLELLLPLLQETLEKAIQLGPASGQTGPARRGDTTVLIQHLALLKERSVLWAEIYRLLSNSIMQTAGMEIRL